MVTAPRLKPRARAAADELLTGELKLLLDFLKDCDSATLRIVKHVIALPEIQQNLLVTILELVHRFQQEIER